jgi:hypothetical protein
LSPLVALFFSEKFMKYSLRSAGVPIAFIALVATAFAARANASDHSHGRADPAAVTAPVPPTRYEPLFFFSADSGPTPSPAENWKALNRVVASYDSMSLTTEDAEPKPAEAAATDSSTAASATPPRPARVPDQLAPQPRRLDPHARDQPKAVK